MSSHEVGHPPAFPPSLVVQVKALACELPHRLGLPLSRLSIADIRQHVITQGLVAEISGATLWRWLSSDALRPWQHRSWLVPHDPDFAANAGRVLDLYERVWEDTPLGAGDARATSDLASRSVNKTYRLDYRCQRGNSRDTAFDREMLAHSAVEQNR